VVAGQIGATEAAEGIVTLPDGRLASSVSDTAPLDPTRLDNWQHVALTFDRAETIFYIDGTVAATIVQTGTVAAVDGPFRLGLAPKRQGISQVLSMVELTPGHCGTRRWMRVRLKRGGSAAHGSRPTSACGACASEPRVWDTAGPLSSPPSCNTSTAAGLSTPSIGPCPWIEASRSGR